MRHKRVAAFLGLVLTGVLLPVTTPAQQPAKVFRIGVLWPAAGPGYQALVQGLRDVGYVEGQNVTFETRWTGVKNFYQPELARELAQLKVDVIVTIEIAGGRAAKEATSTIPIVVVSCDPFEQIVATLARPGGNVTGQSCMTSELTAKKLQLFKEAVPRMSRVAFLYNPNEPGPAFSLKLAQGAAPTLGITLRPVEMREAGDLDSALSRIARERVDGLFVYPDFVTGGARSQIVEFAAKASLPAMYGFRGWVDAGGLMSYGTSQPAMIHRATMQVDKILKGAKPSDLPVEQPTKFALVINRKTAKALGLTIPPLLLLQADQVLE